MTKLANNRIARGTPHFRAAFRTPSYRTLSATERRDFPLLLDLQIAASSSSIAVSAASYLFARGTAAPVAQSPPIEPRIVVLYDND